MTPSERAIEAMCDYLGLNEDRARTLLDLSTAHVLAEMRKAETSGQGLADSARPNRASDGTHDDVGPTGSAHSAPQRVPEDCGFSTDALKLARATLTPGTGFHGMEAMRILARYVVRLHESASPPPAPASDALALAAAVASAGFRVAADLNGSPTLWCIRCGRDSGYHHATCPKSDFVEASPAPASGGDERRWWIVLYPSDGSVLGAFRSAKQADVWKDSREIVPVVPTSRAEAAETRLRIQEAWQQWAAGVLDTLRARAESAERSVDEWHERFQNMDRMRVEAERERDAALARVRDAVNACCSCGGRGPQDDPCVACEVWHRFRALPLSSEEEGT